MITYTQEQLCSFGNFLLKTYGVQVFSTDGKNTPLYQREVTDADTANWRDENPSKESLPLPSQFVHGDKVLFFSMPDDGDPVKWQSCPGLPAEVLAVHFYPGKVKYDLDLLFVGDQRSRIYNVDSVLVTPRT